MHSKTLQFQKDSEASVTKKLITQHQLSKGDMALAMFILKIPVGEVNMGVSKNSGIPKWMV